MRAGLGEGAHLDFGHDVEVGPREHDHDLPEEVQLCFIELVITELGPLLDEEGAASCCSREGLKEAEDMLAVVVVEGTGGGIEQAHDLLEVLAFGAGEPIGQGRDEDVFRNGDVVHRGHSNGEIVSTAPHVERLGLEANRTLNMLTDEPQLPCNARYLRAWARTYSSVSMMWEISEP